MHAVRPHRQRRVAARARSVRPARARCRRAASAGDRRRSRPARMLLPPMKRATNGLAGRAWIASGVPICCTRPSCITTRRSAIAIASVWSCVTMIVVMPPSRCRMRISRAISWRSAASRFDSGSSSSSRRGWIASARASATRCCWPPDSSRGRRCGERLQLHQAQHLGDARLRSRPSPCAASPGRTRRCARRSDAETARSSGTRCPSRADAAAARRCCAPSRRMSPAVGGTKPAIMRSVVVLPQPDGPSSTISSPGSHVQRDVVAPRHARRNACVRSSQCQRQLGAFIAPPGRGA